jgi:3-methyladenine DNA glycosylase AlkD
VTYLADSIVRRTTDTFSAAADAERAAPMRSYMRNRFEFLGITSAPRRQLTRHVLAGAGKLTEPDLISLARACWALEQREYQYFACDVLIKHVRSLTPAFLPVVGELVTTKSWWDTVDALAANVVGPIVAAYPATVSTMDSWATEEDLWLVRTAILHQLRYRERTDAARLFEYCEAQAAHRDFFIRKAIGWALREYAKTDPAAVRLFVDGHPELSPLSRREALKGGRPY